MSLSRPLLPWQRGDGPSLVLPVSTSTRTTGDLARLSSPVPFLQHSNRTEIVGGAQIQLLGRAPRYLRLLALLWRLQ